MSITKLIFFLLVFMVILAGCSESDQPGNLLVPVTSGAYIVSEGTSPSSGKLSFYSVQTDSFYKSISQQNFSFPDGIILNGSQLLISEQGPSFGGNGKLYKMDSTGSVLFSSSPFGSSPYSLALWANKIYVTNGPAGSVSVLDANSLSLIKTIQVGAYPQELIAVNAKVYVCNTSAFGGAADSTVSVIDAAADSVVNTLVLRKDPTSIAWTEEGNLNIVYAGCQGGGGMVYRIDAQTSAKLDSVQVPNGFDKDISARSGVLYFISSANNIDMLNFSSRTVSTVVTNPAPGTIYFYGYGKDPFGGDHYVLDAGNFSVDGKLYIYSSQGVLQKTFSTGVAPRRVIFKKGSASGGSWKPI